MMIIEYDHEAMQSLESFAQTYKILTEATWQLEHCQKDGEHPREVDAIKGIRQAVLENMIRILRPAKEVA